MKIKLKKKEALLGPILGAGGGGFIGAALARLMNSNPWIGAVLGAVPGAILGAYLGSDTSEGESAADVLNREYGAEVDEYFDSISRRNPEAGQKARTELREGGEPSKVIGEATRKADMRDTVRSAIATKGEDADAAEIMGLIQRLFPDDYHNMEMSELESIMDTYEPNLPQGIPSAQKFPDSGPRFSIPDVKTVAERTGQAERDARIMAGYQTPTDKAHAAARQLEEELELGSGSLNSMVRKTMSDIDDHKHRVAPDEISPFIENHLMRQVSGDWDLHDYTKEREDDIIRRYNQLRAAARGPARGLPKILQEQLDWIDQEEGAEIQNIISPELPWEDRPRPVLDLHEIGKR